ncbi:MAG: flavodoxin [Eubacteriales bacterium]|nr:flavodoxin [Eubacteriales bacterium]
MKKFFLRIVLAMLCLTLCCGSALGEAATELVLVNGGTYLIGSPEDEPWRSADETLHEVTLDSFSIGAREVTQAEYEALMGMNPSTFIGAENSVEGVTWLDAIAYCNAKSASEGLTPAYVIDGQNVTWNRAADGYRLPTEAEWEVACRAGTTTPFNTQTSISVDEANYWGHYPYLIEENYFSQENLETKPGIYREETLPVGSFAPNALGLYDMHGNVGEWVWDRYGAYDLENTTDPVGASEGTRRVYRGGAWNDFAKNLRSAYRAAMQPDLSSATVGIRLARNAAAMTGVVASTDAASDAQESGRVLIAYFSWGGNTRGIAEEIQRQTGFDLFEITLVTPYSDDYETVLDQAQADQNVQARPELAERVENMAQYDTILLGYPNWWASIPMPVASFLESYDFSGKTILPFCSHGGGRFGQSLTAIAKLAPNATLMEGLAIEYSGGGDRNDRITQWLHASGISTK